MTLHLIVLLLPSCTHHMSIHHFKSYYYMFVQFNGILSREDTPLINIINIFLHEYNVPSYVPLVDKRYDNHLLKPQTDLPVQENYKTLSYCVH